MFCKVCGMQIPDDTMFCSRCGSKVGNHNNGTNKGDSPSDKYIYASYARCDSSKVMPVIRDILKKGVDIRAEGFEHIPAAGAVVVFVTDGVFDDVIVQRELHYALQYNKEVIVVNLEDVQLPAGLHLCLASLPTVFGKNYDSHEELATQLMRIPAVQRCCNKDNGELYKNDDLACRSEMSCPAPSMNAAPCPAPSMSAASYAAPPEVEAKCSSLPMKRTPKPSSPGHAFSIPVVGGIVGKAGNWLTKKQKRKKESSVALSSVRFSAVVPKTVSTSEYFRVDITMYEDEYRNIVDSLVDEAHKEEQSGYHDVEKGCRVRVVLSSMEENVVIDDPEEESIWSGKYLKFGFMVSVSEALSDKQILLRADIYINDIIATKLKLIVDVTKKNTVEMERNDVLSAFVSYSSNDRETVAKILQGMQKARPDLKLFFDVETLRCGEKWENTIRKEIDDRDVLYLCWSKSASKSEWVDFEWRYAFDRKGEECIEPIPIDPPECCPPPEELKHKHFNDKMVYMIKAFENLK